MLHAIRFFWSLAVLALVLAGAYGFLYGTSIGARMALHGALAHDFGKDDWKNWVDYDGPTPGGPGSYTAEITPLSGRVDDDEPASWRPRAKEWWGALRGSEPALKVFIRYGAVRYDSEAFAPTYSFGVGLDLPPLQIFIGAGVLALLCVFIAWILGKQVDARSREQQIHRPGSVLDRSAQGGAGDRPSVRTTGLLPPGERKTATSPTVVRRTVAVPGVSRKTGDVPPPSRPRE